jgi:hypothetical protein
MCVRDCDRFLCLCVCVCVAPLQALNCYMTRSKVHQELDPHFI